MLFHFRRSYVMNYLTLKLCLEFFVVFIANNTRCLDGFLIRFIIFKLIIFKQLRRPTLQSWTRDRLRRRRLRTRSHVVVKRETLARERKHTDSQHTPSTCPTLYFSVGVSRYKICYLICLNLTEINKFFSINLSARFYAIFISFAALFLCFNYALF